MASRPIAALALLGSVAVNNGATAETLKIAAIDMSRLLQESPQTRRVMLKVEQAALPRRRVITVSQDDLRRNTELLQRDGAVMSREQRESLEREIRDQQGRLKRLQESHQESLSIRRYEDLSRLQAELMHDAREIAGDAGYDLVLPNTLYASPAIDITEFVLRELGARFAAAGGTPNESAKSRAFQQECEFESLP